MQRSFGNTFWFRFTPSWMNVNTFTSTFQRKNWRNPIPCHLCPINLLIMIRNRRPKRSKLNQVNRGGDFRVNNLLKSLTYLPPTLSAHHESQGASNYPLNDIPSPLKNIYPFNYLTSSRIFPHHLRNYLTPENVYRQHLIFTLPKQEIHPLIKFNGTIPTYNANHRNLMSKKRDLMGMCVFRKLLI